MQSKLALVISSFMLVAMSAESASMSSRHQGQGAYVNNNNNNANNNNPNNNNNNNNPNNNNPNNVPISISFAGLSSPQIGGTVDLSALASGGDGSNVSYSAGPGGVCSLSGATLTINGPGTCMVSVTQAGNTASASLTVNAPISISFAGLSSPQIGGTVDLSALVSGGDGSNVAYSAGQGGVCSVSGATLTINGPGTCTVSVTQAGNTASASLTVNALVNPVTFAISGPWSSQALTFSPATSLSGGTVQYESVDIGVCTIAGTTVTAKAIGECRIRATVAASGNYAEGIEEASIMVSEGDLPPECVVVVAGGCGPGYTKANGAFFKSGACSNVMFSFNNPAPLRVNRVAAVFSSDIAFNITAYAQSDYTGATFLNPPNPFYLQETFHNYSATTGEQAEVCRRSP